MIRNVFIVLLWLGTLGSAWAAPPIEAYGRLPGVEFMRLSPSGERYATVAVVGEQRNVIVATIGGQALFGARLGDIKVNGIEWVGDDHVLVIRHTTYKFPATWTYYVSELATVANLGISEKKYSAIFDKIPSVANVVLGYLGSGQVDGHLYAYVGGLTYAANPYGEFYYDHGYRDLYQADLQTGKIKLIAKGGEREHHWVVAPDGTVIAHSEYEEQSATWRLYNGKDRKKLLLEEVAPFADISLIGQGRNAGTILIGDHAGKTDVIAEVSIADGKREELFSEVLVEEFLTDADSGRLIGAITLEPPYAIFFDGTLQARFDATRKAFPGLRMELVSSSRNLDRLIVKTDGGQDSGTFFLVDIASGKASPIGRAYPSIHPADVGPTSLVKFAAADGLTIEGVLTLPPGRKAENLPVVVLPHGGPAFADRIGFDWWAQAYASAGYAVFQPNFRGSTGYGRKFRDAGYGEWGRKMQTDLSDGLAALAAQGVIDPKRACIVGGSYGGYAALAGVTLQHGIYRCAVSIAGPADLPAFFVWEKERHGSGSPVTRYSRAVTGADKEGDEVMRSISPTQFAGQADAPILLIHGKDDTVVPIEQSEKMASALKSAGKPVEFMKMAGEDHWLSREETRTAMLKAAVEFVKLHNPAE